jgi:iron complex outermembrane receptor protein
MREAKNRAVLWAALTSMLISGVHACVALADAGSQSGSTPLKQLTLEQLGSVEVTTASRAPEAVWRTPAAIYVITQNDIERSGATTIPEALRLAPGVEVARIDSNKWSIGIRGFGSRLSRSVLVLIDGRTVYTTLLAGTYWEVQDTVLEDIERIEVIRGPGGTIWGPNAVNGVINIITKEAKKTHGLLAEVGGGNVEQGFFNVRYGGGNGNGVDYRVYAKGFERGPEFHPDGRNFDRWRGAQGGFRMDWAKSPRDMFTLQGDAYGVGSGESVQATSYTPPFSQIVDGTAYLSGGNILGRWNRTLGEGKDVQAQFYYDRTNRHEPNFGDLRDTFDVDVLGRFRLPGQQQISWGLGTRLSRGNDIQVVSGLTFQPHERTDQLFTAFLQDEITLVEGRLSLELGNKFLKTNFTDLELEPSARLLWTPTGTQTVWAAFTHAVRTPSDAERDFFLTGFIGIAPGGLPFFARFNANRNFRAEQLNGYEAGYRQLLGTKLYVDVAGFFNHYSSLFSEDLTGAPFIENDPAPTHILLPAEFGNGLLGTTTGGEIAPEWKPASFWRLRGSYSFLEMHIRKARNSADVGTAGNIQGSSPQHQVAIQSWFDLPKKFDLDFTYRYVSALPGQTVPGSPAESVPAYSTGDVRVGWRMNEHLRLSVVGQNLLQPHHSEFAGDPGPLVGIRRSVYAKIAWVQ